MLTAYSGACLKYRIMVCLFKEMLSNIEKWNKYDKYNLQHAAYDIPNAMHNVNSTCNIIHVTWGMQHITKKRIDVNHILCTYTWQNT